MSQNITRKKKEKGPKYHRWNQTKKIYELRKPYQLDHKKDEPNVRLIPSGMKQILVERGAWDEYLAYFDKKGITYEEYNDTHKAEVVAKPATPPASPSRSNITHKQKIKIVKKSSKKTKKKKTSSPESTITSPIQEKISQDIIDEEPTDLSTPDENDFNVLIPESVPENIPEPEETMAESPPKKGTSLVETIQKTLAKTLKESEKVIKATIKKSNKEVRTMERPLNETLETDKPLSETIEETQKAIVKNIRKSAKEVELYDQQEPHPLEPEKEQSTDTYIDESVIDPNLPTEVTESADTPHIPIPILDDIRENKTKQNDILYPSVDDPEFNLKLARHKEFNDTKYDATIHDFKEQAEILCNASFELMPHQIFVKNFLSNQTPYNSLLLYAGLGTGKTCAAIGVAEEARVVMKQSGMTKSIFIVASPNVQDNFRLQLFDETKLKYENGLWNIYSCVGEALLNEINPTYYKNMSKERVVNQIKSIINDYYVFMGYTQFANFISDSIEAKGIGYSKEEKANIRIKKIHAVFNNRLIIIDEVHNIRITHENKNKKTAELLMQVARYANNMRMLLLSATPMYNSHEEVIWLTNLMNLNDKRSPIKISDVFEKNGNFVEKEGQENGRDMLIRKMTGYISYVRGENPYSFPFRVYPSENRFDPAEPEKYPNYQINGRSISRDRIIQHIPVYLDPLHDFQKDAYDFITKYVFQKKTSAVLPPAEVMLPPDEPPTEKEPDVESPAKNPSKLTKDLKEFSTIPSVQNDDNVTQTNPSQSMDTYHYTQLQRPLESLNMVYPTQRIYNSNMTNEEGQLIISEMLSTEGLERMMSYKEYTKEYHLKYDYEYKTEEYGRIFSLDHIGKYSTKISKICNIIMQTEGIVLVYSQWIDGGIIPMALALEEMGFTRYGTESYTRSLFKIPPTEPVDSLTMKPKSTFGKGSTDDSGKFRQAKYMIITGDTAFSPNNVEDIKYLNQPKNTNGEFVKVVLISRAAAEGIDFKNIRQIHVMEPWFNMNRIEQIIGRGVRNLSHCRLPFEKRNVEIYLHAAVQTNDTETADLYIYRLAEMKAIKIGNVTRLMKETSVDCILNIAQTNFTAENIAKLSDNPTITIQTATGKTVKYTVGDKPFTEICDYKDNCNYVCRPGLPEGQTTLPESEILKTTYSEVFLHANRDRIVKRIRELFKDVPGKHIGKVFYHIDELIPAINIIKEYPTDQIYNALTYLIENQTEYLIDKYGRKGNLINHGEYYIFQPVEISDEHASILERSRPVDYKHHSIQIELPKTAVQTMETKTMETDARIEEQEMALMEGEPNMTTDFTTLYERLKTNYRYAFTGTTGITSGERNWYKNLYIIMNHLIEKHQMEKEQIEKYVVDHIVDEIPFFEKMVLLNQIYDSRNSWKPIEPFDTYMKEYFDKKIIVSDRGFIGITFSEDNKTTKIYVQSGELADFGKWKPAEFTQSNAIIRSPGFSQKNIFNKEALNQLIGFMSWVDTDNEYVFKIRDITDSVNKRGARINQATAKDNIVRLNNILGEPMYSVENVKAMFGENKQRGDGKPRLVPLLEIILRHFQDTNRDNKIWVLNVEQMVINGISNWTKKV